MYQSTFRKQMAHLNMVTENNLIRCLFTEVSRELRQTNKEEIFGFVFSFY
jgi:hypothetical protein